MLLSSKEFEFSSRINGDLLKDFKQRNLHNSFCIWKVPSTDGIEDACGGDRS